MRWYKVAAFRWLIAVAPIGLVLGTGCAHSKQAQWHTNLLTPYPTPITNNAVTSTCDSIGCTIYSFMGMTDPSDPASITPKSYKLVSHNKAWVPIADAPLLNGRAKIAASAVVCAARVYLIGGYAIEEDGQEVTEKRFFRYDPFRDTYIQLADVPIEVDDTVAGVYRDQYIYLMSGWHGPTHKNTQAVQVYDTQNDTWRQATLIPTVGRFGHAGGLVGNRLVFIDGCADTKGYPLQHDTWVGVIDRNDVTKITWENRGPSPFKPTYRAANASGVSLRASSSRKGMLFVGGTDNPYNYNGTGYNKEPSKPLDQMMIYDPIANRWQKVDTASITGWRPTMDHRGLANFNGFWVTIGGMTGAGRATNAVQRLTLED